MFSKAKVEDSELTQVKFDKHGKETTDSKYYAEEIINKEGVNYFIKSYGGALYDPYGTYSNRENSLEFITKKVNYSVFKNFLMYLKTRNSK